MRFIGYWNYVVSMYTLKFEHLNLNIRICNEVYTLRLMQTHIRPIYGNRKMPQLEYFPWDIPKFELDKNSLVLLPATGNLPSKVVSHAG